MSEHGKDLRVLVSKQERWYCTSCGRPLIDVVESLGLIECVSTSCERFGWQLIRPDLASCEVVGFSENAKIPKVWPLGRFPLWSPVRRSISPGPTENKSLESPAGSAEENS